MIETLHHDVKTMKLKCLECLLERKRKYSNKSEYQLTTNTALYSPYVTNNKDDIILLNILLTIITFISFYVQ